MNRLAQKLGTVALTTALAACAADVDHEGMDDPSVASQDSAAKQGTDPYENIEEFAEAFSKNGRLVVVREPGGLLGYAVQGQIGVDDERLGELASAEGDLEQTYLMLKPEASEVPEKLRELASELREQRLSELDFLEPLDLELDARHVLQAKDKAAFFSTACVDFGGGFEGYTADFCRYLENVRSVCTNSTIDSQDRSFAWNETPYPAVHSLAGMSWKPTVPAWTWQWTSWGGSYTDRYACLGLQGRSGNLGITHHGFYTDHVLIPVDE